ncbi:hypothetical protein KQI84_19165 [bacterium]|nr:hypothetical protein [bacterium]
MPSSTSSSDRPIPDQRWIRVFVVTMILSLIAIAAWEGIVRSWGYGPSYNDTPQLWGMSVDRLRAAENKEPIVIVGSSRIRFDLDHETVREEFGDGPIINLAMNGSVPRPVLHMLAEDESFKGTVFLGYVPSLFHAPGGMNLEMTMDWILKEPKRTPAAKASAYLALVPESVFAFLQKEDLALAGLLRRTIPMPGREGYQAPPRLPPYFARVKIERDEKMWQKMETDPAFQKEVQGIWQVLFSFARPLPPPLLDQIRGEVLADIRAIQSRGGEVILVRCPSSGWIREFERETNPRETYWDPLVEQGGCVGVHFEDYESLAGYECPEWSHLTRADALSFSQNLMSILREKRGG